jgi:hypothetical protein
MSRFAILATLTGLRSQFRSRAGTLGRRHQIPGRRRTGEKVVTVDPSSVRPTFKPSWDSQAAGPVATSRPFRQRRRNPCLFALFGRYGCYYSDPRPVIDDCLRGCAVKSGTHVPSRVDRTAVVRCDRSVSFILLGGQGAAA